MGKKWVGMRTRGVVLNDATPVVELSRQEAKDARLQRAAGFRLPEEQRCTGAAVMQLSTNLKHIA